MRDLPAHAGEVVTKDKFDRAQKNMGLQAQWYGSVGVYNRQLRSPDLFTMECYRVGADLLQYARAMAEGTPGPAGIEYLMSQDDRDLLATIIPVQAEAAMVCRHSFRVDGTDAAAIFEAAEQAAGKWFATLHPTGRVEILGHAGKLLAEDWSGEPANGIARVRVLVKEWSPSPGKVDIMITSYSWRLPDGS